MYTYEQIDIGTYRGDEYALAGFVEPDPSDSETYYPDKDANEYGVALYRVAAYPHEGNKQIVRMDTCHGRPHMDLKCYPPEVDVEQKIWLDEGYEYKRMKQYLLTHWKRFVDLEIQYNE